MSGTMIRIHPSGTTERIRWEKSSLPDWKVLKELCGDYIERVVVRFEKGRRNAFVAENGHILQLPFNRTATQLLDESYAGQAIVGPIVIWVPDKKARNAREKTDELATVGRPVSVQPDRAGGAGG